MPSKPSFGATIGLILASLAGCAAQQLPVNEPKHSITPAKNSSPVAMIDTKKIYVDDLKAYEKQSGLTGRAALEDLIDLELEAQAAKKNDIDYSTIKTPAGRAQVDFQLAKALSLNVPEPTTQLVVDHAWVKDSKRAAAQAKQKQEIEQLREKVIAGTPLPEAWRGMKLTAMNWHVGEHETYATNVLPPEAKDLKANDVSVVMVGDGGLHLFKVYERKDELPPAEAVRSALHTALREKRIIEIYEVK
jgi:hypothetical protein